MKVYTIYDRLAETAGDLFTARNNAVAKRSFRNFMEKQAISPQDYSLYCLGEWNSEKMDLTIFEKPEFLDVPSTPSFSELNKE